MIEVIELEIPESVKAETLRLIQEFQIKNPGCQLGIGGSWSSPKDFLDEDSFACDFFREAVVKNLTKKFFTPPPHPELDVCGWANVYKSGDFIARHNHSKSHKGGENKFAGIFNLQGDAKIFFECYLGSVNAKPGMLILFPANLDHWIKKIENPRISLAFSVRVQEAILR